MVLAYLDANSGAMLASVAVSGVAAAGVAVQQVRHRVKRKFSRKGSEETVSDVGDGETTVSAADAEVVADEHAVAGDGTRTVASDS